MTVEVTPTLASVLKGAIEAHMSDVHVAMPGRVVSYDASSQSVSVEPLVRRGYVDNDTGNRIAEKLPIINHVPVVNYRGGGFRIVAPLAAGDTVLLIFSSTSLDQWLAKGGDVDPIDDRRHAFSDAVAIPGLSDYTNAITDATSDSMMIGREGGVATIEITDTEILAGGTSALALKSDVDSLRTILNTHVHSGVSTGAGSSGPLITPVSAMTGTSVLKGG